MSLILLVDTDPEFTYLIERYCLTISWQVAQAASVEQALEQIKRKKPAMIMINLLLPPDGGWAALRELRNSGEIEGIPVTVYSSIPDEEQAWVEGVDFCLWKPVMLEEFIAALEAADLLPPAPADERR
ncbi:MAG: response regulator [Chloroflexi bacterium]|nr:response regulator [Chloroflexota bacterium]